MGFFISLLYFSVHIVQVFIAGLYILAKFVIFYSLVTYLTFKLTSDVFIDITFFTLFFGAIVTRYCLFYVTYSLLFYSSFLCL